MGLVRAAGFDLARPGPEGNFYIVSATCNYKSFARYFDELTLHSVIRRLGSSSVHFRHSLWVTGTDDPAAEPRLCAEAHDTLVWLNSDMRPAPIPQALRQSLEKFVERRPMWSDGQPRSWKIAVGSQNPAKVGAAREVLGRIDPTCQVEGSSVNEGLPRQPWGYEQTRAGAEARARRALAAAGADLGIGMEAGLVERHGQVYVTCWCAVSHREGWSSMAAGAEMPLPEAMSDRLQGQRRDLELGPVIDELAGVAGAGRSVGAIGVLTGGLLNRQQAWEHALIYALAPALHPSGRESMRSN